MTRLRPAVAADAERVHDLALDTLGPDTWSWNLVREACAGEVPFAVVVVAVDDDDDVVAFAVGSLTGEVSELQLVAVAAGRRRTGLARRLVTDLVARAAADGAERMMLEVREDNAGALAFYGAAGFAEVARRPRYYRDGTTAVVLERILVRS